MELISYGKEVLQSIAEHAVSYKIGQMVLRQIDRVLWVIEKSARWAVPPPLDQDERPQPELVRPLPWVLFLILLLILRVTRESVSVVNLVMGKPPLRSADVVMYIQGKRRYLRTLKYQGNRMMRARTSSQRPAAAPWYSGVRSLFEFTMCFRSYTNNNTAARDETEQMLVVKRTKPDRDSPPVSRSLSGTEDTMERLIEKMMVNLNADSEDDSSYTLTNANSTRTDTDTETEQDTDASICLPYKHAHSTPERELDTISLSPTPPKNTTVIKNDDTTDNTAETSPPKSLKKPNIVREITGDESKKNDATFTKPNDNGAKGNVAISTPKNSPAKDNIANKSDAKIEPNKSDVAKPNANQTNELKSDSLPKPKELKLSSNKEETLNFIEGEKCDAKAQRSPKKKFANGRVKSENSSNKMKGAFSERRELSVPTLQVPPSMKNNGSPEPKKENIRH